MKAEGYSQRPFSLPVSLVKRLDRLKKLHQLKSRDAAAAIVLQQVMDEYKVDGLPLPPVPEPDERFTRITVNLHQEHLDYLDKLTRRFRGVTVSVAFEAVLYQVQDLMPVQQLKLEMGVAVSG